LQYKKSNGVTYFIAKLMAFLFALAGSLSSPLGSALHVFIPDVRWFYQTKSQGIVVFDCLHLELEFYPPYYTSFAN